MNLREAAQQALEYIEQHAIIGGIPIRDALRAALAEDAMQRLTDEPVAWISEVVCVGPNLGVKRYDKLPIQSLQPGFYKHTPLYTAPPKREPLTDDEIRRIDDATPFHEGAEWEVRFARAIEQAHGIGGEE